ncbi:MAG: hypothetical protein IJT20_01850 [Synergistaceae bacterium]|nr:hypothetical protein [Synergistaceae bacterium]
MRIFKGLENIHSVIDRHEIEWRREQGEPVEDLPEFSIEESVRRRLTKSTAEGSGKFSADRFLGASAPKKNKTNVEVVDVIKQKDGKPHSWLYNEVLKAIQDAAGNNKNTKVVAVFIPVVQNGKEFEDLPVDASVTLPPVNEEDINFKDLIENSEPEPEISSSDDEGEAQIEHEEPEILQEQEPIEAAEEISEPEEQPKLSEDFNLIPESQDKPDAELAEAFSVMEEKLDEALSENKEQEPDTVPEVLQEEPEVSIEPEPEPEEAEDEIASDALEVPTNEVLDFEEFPVIREEETDAPVEVEDVIEEITPEDNLDEPVQSDETNEEEKEELAPLDDLEDDEIFEEHEAVNDKVNSLSEEENGNESDNNEEIIRLDLGE